jgi:hypothetical protein
LPEPPSPAVLPISNPGLDTRSPTNGIQDRPLPSIQLREDHILRRGDMQKFEKIGEVRSSVSMCEASLRC